MLKILTMLMMKSSILVGGQAVIEGVMMRVPGAYATAVRLKNNDIKVLRTPFTSIIEKYKMNQFVILRGMIHLFESMRMGYRTLDWSAQMNEDNFKPQTGILYQIQEYIMSALSIMFALSLFLFLPLFFTFYLEDFINRPFIFNSITGVIRIFIFLTYLILISRMNDIKTLFQYHGAEHKVVYNFESGLDVNVNNAQKFSRLHPRCGTSFVFIIMLVTIFTHAIIDSIALLFLEELTLLTRFILHIVFLPVVAGVGYEVLKFLAKHQTIFIFKILSQPGLWLQHITTKEPSKEQLEVSVRALREAFGKDNIESFTGKKFVADAIG